MLEELDHIARSKYAEAAMTSENPERDSMLAAAENLADRAKVHNWAIQQLQKSRAVRTTEARAMEVYRAYLFAEDGKIVGVEGFHSEDDGDALIHAKQYAGGCAVEVWNLERFVGKLNTAKTTKRPPHDLADRMIGAPQPETFNLPIRAARLKAREILEQRPQAGYMSVVEHWRQLADGRIEFTKRHLPAAD
jgi:hypothetical protein